MHRAHMAAPEPHALSSHLNKSTKNITPVALQTQSYQVLVSSKDPNAEGGSCGDAGHPKQPGPCTTCGVGYLQYAEGPAVLPFSSTSMSTASPQVRLSGTHTAVQAPCRSTEHP